MAENTDTDVSKWREQRLRTTSFDACRPRRDTRRFTTRPKTQPANARCGRPSNPQEFYYAEQTTGDERQERHALRVGLAERQLLLLRVLQDLHNGPEPRQNERRTMNAATGQRRMASSIGSEKGRLLQDLNRHDTGNQQLNNEKEGRTCSPYVAIASSLCSTSSAAIGDASKKQDQDETWLKTALRARQVGERGSRNAHPPARRPGRD
jgi:hypothetical protein